MRDVDQPPPVAPHPSISMGPIARCRGARQRHRRPHRYPPSRRRAAVHLRWQLYGVVHFQLRRHGPTLFLAGIRVPKPAASAEPLVPRPRHGPHPRQHPRRSPRRVPARFFRLSLSGGLRFIHVGSDSVYLARPVPTKEFLLAPSEIADVVVDFAGAKDDAVTLRFNAPTPYPGDHDEKAETVAVMKFLVARKPEHDPSTMRRRSCRGTRSRTRGRRW
uniref:Uncharacterized protein n=1 Tax=Aegilops tauschii subsp. strangulata TaxID=200361 RepID=A0A452XLS1_AEGTS